MWMSFMTSGVKILDEPRIYFLLSAGARERDASPVAVRLTVPLPLVLASATARGFTFVLAGFLLFVFFAGFLAMADPHLTSFAQPQSTSFFSLGSRLS